MDKLLMAAVACVALSGCGTLPPYDDAIFYKPDKIMPVEFADNYWNMPPPCMDWASKLNPDGSIKFWCADGE